MHQVLTQDICYAIGKDAGNRNMRKQNRTRWNNRDWNIASKATNALLDKLKK